MTPTGSPPYPALYMEIEEKPENVSLLPVGENSRNVRKMPQISKRWSSGHGGRHQNR